MEKLLRESIAEGMQNGMMPHVPEELSLEQSLFPAKLHPRNASLERELHAWASKLGPRYAKDVQQTIKVSLVACYFWPCTIDQPPRRMLTLLKLMYWFFLVEHEADDYVPASTSAVDKLLHADKASCRGVVEALVAITASTGAPAVKDQGRGDVPVVISVALEWWAEMREDGMSLTQQARLIIEVIKYLQSQKLERMLMNGPPLSLELYMPLRRDIAAGGPICMAAEYGLGIELDEEAVSSALVLQLQDAVIDHAFWINDIYSFPKEFAKGDYVNLVYLLHARNNNNNRLFVPFHVAVSEAWQMVKARQLDCARLAQQIAHSPRLASKPGLVSYAEALCLLTAGNWTWTVQVPRYNSLSERHGPSPQACAASLNRRPTTLNKALAANANVSLRGNALSFRGNALNYRLPRTTPGSVLPLSKWPQALSFA